MSELKNITDSIEINLAVYGHCYFHKVSMPGNQVELLQFMQSRTLYLSTLKQLTVLTYKAIYKQIRKNTKINLNGSEQH